MSSSTRFLAVLLFLLSCCGQAHAELITMEFEGVLEIVPDALHDQFSSGEAISGRYVIDTATLASLRDIGGTLEYGFPQAVVDVEFSIGDQILRQTGKAGEIQVWDVAGQEGAIRGEQPYVSGSGGRDEYLMAAIVAGGDLTSEIAGLFALQFSDLNADAFSGDFDLSAPVPVASFSDPLWTLDLNIVDRLAGSITSMRLLPTAVPEPVCSSLVWLALVLVRGQLSGNQSA